MPKFIKPWSKKAAFFKFQSILQILMRQVSITNRELQNNNTTAFEKESRQKAKLGTANTHGFHVA